MLCSTLFSPFPHDAMLNVATQPFYFPHQQIMSVSLWLSYACQAQNLSAEGAVIASQEE